ncbi:transposase IS4 family protein [Candidatus Vecturithrix granuli]|uniref:Transposase IS4 family protein n=1 Tax=Vecturithrix granuli TaxID=1499967 RepID=A0A0S6W745_VECG1|nr:transposase IS4 family protein [Candidatus Vecturithrix granuli]
MHRTLYPTDLTDKQWNLIKDLIPPEKPGGRHRTLDMREVINAMLYVTVSGIQWRLLPHDFPNWSSVYGYFRTWRNSGVWQRLHDTLRAQVRPHAERHTHPTAGCLDSQSVKTTQGPGERGYDAGKHVNGRKRHLLVDTLSLLLAEVVTVASVQDRDGARLLLSRLGGACKKLRKIWVDGGYRGHLVTWVASQFRFVLEPVLRSQDTTGFTVLPRRWLVERTFSWLNLCRRLSKDYECQTTTSETFIYIAMTRLMLRRLAPG